MPTTVYVDVVALQGLANQLSTIHDALDSAADDFAEGGDETGSAVVAGALHHFCTGWKDGRRTITDEIGNLVAAVRGAAEAYEHAETQLSDSSTAGAVRTTSR